MGNNWLRTAALSLPADRVVLEETDKVVIGEKDVIGYAGWGSNDPHRHQRNLGFVWLPGAIATEFVSSDGRTFQRPPAAWTIGAWQDVAHWFAGSPQTLTADYIHEGATGCSGHVYEPFLEYTPHPDYLLPAYFRGRNLAESYYLAIPGLSWPEHRSGRSSLQAQVDSRRSVIVNHMPVTIENQVVLVVGASSGIGRETAALFARAGARVMASARREKRLCELKKSLASEGRTIEILAADAGDASQMADLAQRTRERLGEIDVLVFSAGTNVPDRSMKRLTTEIWDMMVKVNLNAAYYITGARYFRPCGREAPATSILHAFPRCLRPLRRCASGAALPGRQARVARAGTRDTRRGKGERHSDLRGLPWPGRYRDTGTPSR